MTRRAPSSGARASPGLRDCAGGAFAEGFPVGLPEGFPEGLPDGLPEGLAGAGLGFAGCFAVAAGFADDFAAGGFPLACASTGKLAKRDATRTLVKAKTRADVEKRMAQGR